MDNGASFGGGIVAMNAWERACRAVRTPTRVRFVLPSVAAALFAAAAVAAAAPSAPAVDETRVALVIGNGSYAGAPLVNPIRDARAVATSLRSMGFTVVEAHDAGKIEMEQAIARAHALLDGRRGVGMLYYAGHGIQLDWHNYLVPVDARLASAADIRTQTVDVEAVVEAFRSAGTRANIFVLDACRDNPFGAAAAGKGLAPVDAPSGSVFAYATAPGNVAADGDAGGGNGLYTQFLVREMARPGARIEDIFKRVRFQVRQLSRGQQIPWESTSLEGDFVFRPLAPNDPSLSLDREQILKEEVADWRRIQQSTDPDDIYRFLRAHPSGSLSEVALARLERLDRAAIVPEALPGAPLAKPGARRYRVGDDYLFAYKDFVTGNELRRAHLRVTSIDGDTVTMNDGAFVSTMSGADVKVGEGSFDPPFFNLPASEYKVGDKFTSRTRFIPERGPRVWREYVTRVVAYEKVTVPAGTFMAFRLETTMSSDDGSTAAGVRWNDPEWGQSLRSEWSGRDSRYNQSWGTTRELVRRVRGADATQAADSTATDAVVAARQAGAVDAPASSSSGDRSGDAKLAGAGRRHHGRAATQDEP